MSELNAASFLLANKALATDPAIIVPTTGRSYTHQELKITSELFGRYLGAAGLKASGRVAIIGPNSFFWSAVYLGVLRAGCVAVPLPTNSNRLFALLEFTEPHAIVIDSSLLRQYSGLAERMPGIPIIVSEQKGKLTSNHVVSFSSACEIGRTWELNFPQTSSDGLAALMLTSGSTGTPRAVMISHQNIVANTESIIAAISLRSDDRMMVVLPFAYCYGLSLLHTHIRLGGSVVLGSGSIYSVERIFQEIGETKSTGFAGVPSHFNAILNLPSLAILVPESLRHMQQAGGRLAPDRLRALRAVVPTTVKMHVMYGQTEATARLSCLEPAMLDLKVGSIGQGIPGVELQIVADDQRQINKSGEIGEITARGNNIACGYWKDTEATARTFRNGVLYTGDLATIDEDGFFFIVDRRNDFLKCAGVRVSCREIEDQLMQSPDLIEVAVVGAEDAVAGEAVVVFAVLGVPQDSSAKDRIKAFCASRLRSELVPKHISFLEQLPKNDAGKILKQDLKELANRLAGERAG